MNTLQPMEEDGGLEEGEIVDFCIDVTPDNVNDEENPLEGETKDAKVHVNSQEKNTEHRKSKKRKRKNKHKDDEKMEEKDKQKGVEKETRDDPNEQLLISEEERKRNEIGHEKWLTDIKGRINAIQEEKRRKKREEEEFLQRAHAVSQENPVVRASPSSVSPGGDSSLTDTLNTFIPVLSTTIPNSPISVPASLFGNQSSISTTTSASTSTTISSNSIGAPKRSNWDVTYLPPQSSYYNYYYNYYNYYNSDYYNTGGSYYQLLLDMSLQNSSTQQALPTFILNQELLERALDQSLQFIPLYTRYRSLLSTSSEEQVFTPSNPISNEESSLPQQQQQQQPLSLSLLSLSSSTMTMTMTPSEIFPFYDYPESYINYQNEIQAIQLLKSS